MKIVRKQIIIIAAGIILLGSIGYVGALNGWWGGGGSIPEDTFSRGLVGYWNMDEGSGQAAKDLSGNGNNGTLGAIATAGADDPVWSKGKNGGGLKFDGKDDYVDAGNGASLNNSIGTGSFTVSTWLKTAVKPSEQRADIVWKYSGWGFLTRQRQTTGYYEIFLYDGTNSVVAAATDKDYADNNWHYFTAVRNKASNKVYIYIDGIQKDVQNDTTNNLTNSANLLIAKKFNYSYFSGSIDDVRIYNRALSAEEVRYHYNHGGPVAEWKFDEGSGQKAFDSTENNNNGWLGGTSAVEASDPTWTTGKYGGALSFDGGDYVDAGNKVGTNLDITNTITMEAWVYPRSTSGYRNIVNNFDFVSFGASKGYLLQIENGYFQIFLRNIGAKADAMPYLNKWVHIVATFDGTNSKLYLDGVLKSTVALSPPLSQTTYNFAIGKSIEANGEYWSGSIDDVRIYNYARSADEIRLDYNAGLATYLGPTGKTCVQDPASCMNDGLAGYWNMEEGGGQAAKDLSGNGNNGTLGATTAAGVDDPVWSKGKNGGGLKFDGKDDYVEILDNTSIRGNLQNSFSLAMWINSSESGTGKVRVPIGILGNYELAIDSNDQYRFQYRDSGGLWRQDWNTGQLIALNQWEYITLTFDGTKIQFYKNGQYKSEQNITVLFNYTGNLRIGHQSSGTDYFNGLIDEVRIYNRALSAEEVRYHYNHGGPVAEWKFDEGTGQKAHDESFNNNDGWLGGTSASEASDPTWVAGKFGGALSFDGSNDYVQAPDASNLDITSDITLQAWINPITTLPDESVLVRKAPNDCGNYNFQIKTHKLALLSTNECAWTVAGANSTVVDGVWQHVAVSVSGTTLKYYINGVNTDTITGWNIGGATSDVLSIGGYAGAGVNDSFKGFIDSVRIYNYARTQEQILQDYNGGAATHLK